VDKRGGPVVLGIYGEKTISYRALVWKPEGKRPFGIPKHRLENKKLYTTYTPSYFFSHILKYCEQHPLLTLSDIRH